MYASEETTIKTLKEIGIEIPNPEKRYVLKKDYVYKKEKRCPHCKFVLSKQKMIKEGDVLRIDRLWLGGDMNSVMLVEMEYKYDYFCFTENDFWEYFNEVKL